jgi:hypothetical protein
LLVKEVALDGAEELFGLRQSQPRMLDALLVLVEGDDIGAGLCLTLIVTDDELQFDTHSRAAPGSSSRRRGHAILPDFGGFPQHLHALLGLCGALAWGCVWREARRGSGAWSVAPPDMDKEADHHESDHEEWLKQYVRYHDAVSLHRAKRRLLCRIHLLSNYPSSTGTGPLIEAK